MPPVQFVSRSVDVGTTEKGAGSARTADIAEDLYREIEDFSPEELEAEQTKVRKLIDWRIMPIVSLLPQLLGNTY